MPSGRVVWFTGLSGAGKTTLAQATYRELEARGIDAEVLDGDELRATLSKGLGFRREDREEHLFRVGYVARLLARHGVVVLVAAIAPYRAVREELRRSLPNFVEVYVATPLEVCEARDPKGLYRRARAGELRQMSGIDDPYEPPLAPEVICRTDLEPLSTSVRKILKVLECD
jgi:adenylylsulfate kinase